MSDSDGITAAGEEYLEWIYRLSKEREEVSPLDLARALRISPASVTAMVKRLLASGAIEYRLRRGITLTARGREIASGVVRRHGLVERLLTDVLDVPWEEADELACKIEHYITPRVEERLVALLGNPTTCPHGQPIDLEEPDHTRPLAELAPGEEASVARTTDEDTDFLTYLSELGMRPGARVRLEMRAPFNGPLTVTVGDARHAIGPEVAEKVRVAPVPAG